MGDLYRECAPQFCAHLCFCVVAPSEIQPPWPESKTLPHAFNALTALFQCWAFMSEAKLYQSDIVAVLVCAGSLSAFYLIPYYSIATSPI